MFYVFWESQSLLIAEVGSFQADHVDVVTPEWLRVYHSAARIGDVLREKLLCHSSTFPFVIWIDDSSHFLVVGSLFCFLYRVPAVRVEMSQLWKTSKMGNRIRAKRREKYVCMLFISSEF